MVDHIFIFTPAIQYIKHLIEKDELGKLFYYDSVRINLGLFQSDVNVIWDLAVHDLAIIDYLFDEKPSEISATSALHIDGQPENLAYLNFIFPSGFNAHVHINWLAPVKVRQTLIGGAKKMVLYNDIEPDEKIKIYDRGLDNGGALNPNLQVDYRLGDVTVPMLKRQEALSNSLNHFLYCVFTNSRPVTDSRSGERILKMLEAASESAAARGTPVNLDLA